nr:hypothetical protein [uncultured Acetatifactor sp.]
MSRSFKKTPIYKDGGYQSDGKRIANRKVRRAPNDTFSTGKRKLYKKIYKPYPLETAFRPRKGLFNDFAHAVPALAFPNSIAVKFL